MIQTEPQTVKAENIASHEILFIGITVNGEKWSTNDFKHSFESSTSKHEKLGHYSCTLRCGASWKKSPTMKSM